MAPSGGFFFTMAINPILTAAKQGQWHLMERYLPGASPEQVNERDDQGLTPLMYGAVALEVATVTELIKAGADVNVERLPHGITPLMLLSALPLTDTGKKQQGAIAHLLIQGGAAVNRGNDDQTTALMMAAYRNNNYLVQILLEAGADPDLQDNQGTTALEWGIKHQNIAMVQGLLKSKVQLDLMDGEGHLPLTLALKLGNETIFHSLRRAGAALDEDSWFTAVAEGQIGALMEFIKADYAIAQADDQGDTALHLACLEGHEQIVQVLLENQVPLDVANQAGDTPLQLAIAQGQLGIVQQLLGAGADPTFSVQGESPLLTAFMTEGLIPQTQREIVNALLTAGVSVNQFLWENKTPLIMAADLNLTTVIPILSDHGADPNCGDASGCTALMWACHRGHLEVVKTLLDRFPTLDINRKNQGGQTALNLAQLNHHRAIVTLLQSHQAHGQ